MNDQVDSNIVAVRNVSFVHSPTDCVISRLNLNYLQ